MVTADLQKWDDAAKKAKNHPLFLDREPYVAWDALSYGDRADPAKIQTALEAVLSRTAAQADMAFGKRRLHGEESVDGYEADLTRPLKHSRLPCLAEMAEREQEANGSHGY